MVATGVNDDGRREVAGAAEELGVVGVLTELLSWLKSRGCAACACSLATRLPGWSARDPEVLLEAACQRRVVRFYRNGLAKVSETRCAKVAAMLKAIPAMESREASEAKALEVADELDSMRLKEAAKVVRDGYAETLTYTRFPREHWRRIRTNNAIERLNREIRRRTRVVGTFPDGKSALMLVTARLKYVAESEWGSRRYLDVTLLEG